MLRQTLVVDASVAIKWILPESDTERALRVQESFQNDEIDLIAPFLVVSEVANVLWKRQRRGDFDAGVARRCFVQFLRDCPVLVDSAAVSNAALALAAAHDRPFYDCLYLAWALEQRCDLITADERFFNALATTYSNIRLLKTFE
jgi:predicted nucleic acid-binding protein